MSKRRLHSALCSAFLVGLVAASSWPAHAIAAPKWAEADKHFRHAVQLYKESDFAAALLEFERAYEVDPKFQVLYNIAETHYQLQDYANALKTFRRYLDEGGSKIPAKRRKEVEAELVTLGKRVATLTIQTNEPGATVSIDDVVVGTTPLEPQMVSAGRRKVTVALSGRIPATQRVDLVGGDEKTVRLELAPPSVRVETVTTQAPPPSAPPPSMLPPVIGWSVTGALLTGGVITGALALGASSDLEAELVRYPGDPDALASAKSSAFGLALATDILLVSSAAAAAVSIYLTVDYAAESSRSGASTEPVLRLVVLPGGAGLAGSF